MSISVTNSLSLRLFYRENRTLINTSDRKEATKGTLSFADSSALRAAIGQLATYDFERASNDDITEKLTAFADIYNNTLQSGSKYISEDSSVESSVKGMKNLSKEYSEQLSKAGISIDKDGYMKMSDSASKNLSHSTFDSMFGKESEYMKKLYTYARNINKHVDVRL